MKTLIRWILGLAGVALVLTVALSLAVMFLVDPNDYKDDIAALVSEQTGRTFEIEGDLDLQTFPCCGVALGPVTLGNPPGFPEQPFARIERALVDLQLWPLLTRRELRFGKIELQGFDARLLSRADGSTNWDFAAAVKEDQAAEPQDEPTSDIALAIAGVEITDGKLGYTDEAAGTAINVSDINLSTSTIRPGKPFDLQFAFGADGLVEQGRIEVQMDTQVVPNEDASQFELMQLNADVRLTGDDLPGKTATIALELAAARGLGGETVDLQDLNARIDVAGARLDVTGAGRLVNNAPELQGQLKVRNFSPRELLGNLDDEPVTTRDPAVLQSAEVQADWQYAGDTAALDNIVGTLDDTRIMGWLRITSLAKEELSFDLQVDALDLDRYASPETAEDEAGAGNETAGDAAFGLPVETLRTLNLDGRLTIGQLRTAGAQLDNLSLGITAKQGQIRVSQLKAKLDGSAYAGDLRLDVTGKQPQLAFEMQVDELDLDRYMQTGDQEAADANTDAATGDESLDLPVDELRQLYLDGRIKAGKLKFSNARLSNVDVNISARNGVIRLSPLTANLYNGSYAGDMQIDVTGKQPKLSVNEKLSSVQLGALLADVSKIKNLDGVSDARVTATATGTSVNELLGNLAGDAALDLQKGVFRGVDLWYEIRKARALLKREAPPPAPAELYTDISKLAGTAKFADGEITNNDFLAQASYLGINGKGKVNLLQSTLDYRLEGKVVGTPTFDDGKTLSDMNGAVLPITIKGKFASPSVKVDVGRLVVETGKRKLLDRLEKKLGVSEPAPSTGAAAPSDAAPAEQTTEQPQEEQPAEDPKEQLKKSLLKMLGT